MSAEGRMTGSCTGSPEPTGELRKDALGADALALTVEEVTRALSRVGPGALEAFATRLRDPQRAWFCGGQGRSGLVARMVAMRLMHLGRRSHAIGEATSPAVAPGDVVLLISKSGTTPTTLHWARRAREVGAEVLAVTGRSDTELASVADAIVVVDQGSSRQFGGTVFEQASLLSLDAVVLMAGAEDPRGQALMGSRHANLE